MLRDNYLRWLLFFSANLYFFDVILNLISIILLIKIEMIPALTWIGWASFYNSQALASAIPRYLLT